MIIINNYQNQNHIVGKTKFIRLINYNNEQKLLINETFVNIYLYKFYKNLWYF